MEYSDNKPIYQQITDYCLRQISLGLWRPGKRIPSTRELAITLGVNNRTIIRAYDELESKGFIQVQRGQGCYCHPDAPQRVREKKQWDFNTTIIENFLDAMEECGYTLEDTIEYLRQHYERR